MKYLFYSLVIVFLSCGTTKNTTKPQLPTENSGYLFQFEHMPNTSFRAASHIVMKNETIVEGVGGGEPVVNQMTTSMVITSKLGNETAGIIPLQIHYDEHSTTSDPLPASTMALPDFTDVVAHGHIKDNEVNIDSLTNVDAAFSEQLKQGLVAAFKNTSIDFPDEKMMINDSFVVHTPLEIPLPEGSSNDVYLTTTYTLVSVSDGIASFDIRHSAEGNISMAGFKLPIKSNGTGIMHYDMKSNYVTKSHTEDLTTSSMDMNGIKMETKIKTSSKIEITKL